MTAEHVNSRSVLPALPDAPGAGAEPAPPPAVTSQPLDLTAMDAHSVRLLLTGGSVVDWRRLAFESPDEVARFLEVNGYSLGDPDEMARFWALHARAVGYVGRTFDVTIPERVRHPASAPDLFLAASGPEGVLQRTACVVLKIMHVLNHLEARRLAYLLSVSERELFEAAARRFGAHIARMREGGLPLLGYEQSTKSEHSLITKLLSKPRVTAAQIFDKLRFRLITRERDDLVPVMVWLTRHLLPFSQVIPGESHNTILDEAELTHALAPHGDLSEVLAPRAGQSVVAPSNPATARDFGMINFVVDLPIRVRSLCPASELEHLSTLGHLVFVTLELQLFDRETFRRNTKGDANHDAYKNRQRLVVAQRLWGEDAPDLKA